MKKNELVRAVLITFAVAFVLYVVSFQWIQHRRETKGPWVVEFCTDENGVPQISISQTNLKIAGQLLTFSEQQLAEKNLRQTMRFDGPKTNVPFGEIVFQDPTFLPGTVMFNFWGHGVELMPRTMIINNAEFGWHSTNNIMITGEGKFERRPVKKPFIL